VVFRMYRMFFVFLKCTIQGGPKVDVLLIASFYLWLKFWEGIDKYWIVPVRKLFYFHHCLYISFLTSNYLVSTNDERLLNVQRCQTCSSPMTGRYTVCSRRHQPLLMDRI